MKLSEIEKLLDSDTFREGLSFSHLINHELCLGQTRFVCRNGTLSDGHEKITDAQRYYQSIKEMYTIATEMNLGMARAMEYEADRLDGELELKLSKKESSKLRAKAKIFRATTQLESLHITLKDQFRMLDEYNKVRMELSDAVRSKYPEGIEQAEYDNWKAVGEYLSLKKQVGAHTAPLTHIPLPVEEKARLGMEMNMPELQAWFLVKNRKDLVENYKGNIPQYLEDKITCGGQAK